MGCAASSSDHGTVSPYRSRRRGPLHNTHQWRNRIHLHRTQRRRGIGTGSARPTVSVLRARPANQEVIGLDVAVDEVLLVYRLHAGKLCAAMATRAGGRRSGSTAAAEETGQKASASDIFSGRRAGCGRDDRGGQTYHLPRCHADRLDRELAPAHVEEVFQARTKQVDDEDVVQALLPEVVYLRYPGWLARPAMHHSGRTTEQSRKTLSGAGQRAHNVGLGWATHCIRPVCGTSDTHPGVGGPPPSGVPVGVAHKADVSPAAQRTENTGGRTNLIATVCELSRFVPGGVQGSGSKRGLAGGRGGRQALRTFEDDTERPLADLLADAIVHADDVVGGGRGVRVCHGVVVAGEKGAGGRRRRRRRARKKRPTGQNRREKRARAAALKCTDCSPPRHLPVAALPRLATRIQPA